MSITPKYPASEAQHNPYAYGYNNAADHATTAARIAAFGAIRRAAAVARHYDELCRAALARNDELFCERYDENGEAIREAIRAAIGSEKA